MDHLNDDPTITKYTTLTLDFDPNSFGFPFFVKPKSGSGSRGIKLVTDKRDLSSIPRNGSYIAQTFLFGKEYSVDTYVSQDGDCLASVVRERIKVDSGVAVIGKTVLYPELSKAAERISKRLGLRYVSNLQFKEDVHGDPKLLEINPRFPGTMPLTVAAGIDMPGMCLDEVLGHPLPEKTEYKAIAMIRTWQEAFVSCEELSCVNY